MTDMLHDGMIHLRQQMRAFAARMVTYRRGTSSVALLATPGLTRFWRDTTGQMEVWTQMKDWVLDAADLILDGQAVDPQESDEIIDIQDGVTRIYRVATPAGDEQPWREIDEGALRIHTVLSEKT